LCVCPDDDDASSPDLSLARTRFGELRNYLAQAEGITLARMRGFEGDRPWSETSTSLRALLDHPDDEGGLSRADCDAILPRLEEIIRQWVRTGDADSLLARHIDDARQLVTVLRYCVANDVPLLFA
jgi:hypothetical protein